jgi:hypothetical protein
MDKSQTIIAALIFISTAIALIAGIYWTACKRLGVKSVNLNFPLQLAKGAIYFGFLMVAGFILESKNFNGLLLIIVLMIGSVIVSIRMNRIKYPREAIVFDLTTTNKSSTGEVGVFVILGIFNVLISLVFLVLHHESPSVSSSIIFSLALGILLLMIARNFIIWNRNGRTLITKTHFIRGLEIVKLQDIKRFVWGQDWDGKTVLFLQKGGPLSVLRQLKIRVPTNLRGHINEFLDATVHP